MRTKRSFINKIGLRTFNFIALPFKWYTIFLGLALLTVSVQGQTLKLLPYLQNPTPDAITIMWQTNDPSYSWIEYGTDIGDLDKARSVENGIVTANVTRHKVRIKGLTPDTKYYYRICTQKVLEYKAYSKKLGPEEKTEFFSFTTLGPASDSFTCLIFTDLHDKLDLFDKLMTKINSHDIEFNFCIFNGDNFQDPSSEGHIFNLLRHYNQGIDAANKNVFYLRGNHEIRGPYALQWPSFFDFEDGRNYSAFSYGDTRFVLLDNGEDKGDGQVEYSGLIDFDGFRLDQTEWLKKEIAGSDFKKAFRKILVHHVPIYGWTNSYDPGFIPCFDLWDPIFRAAPFDIDITGHLHRFRFQSTNTVNNPFPLVVGGGNTEASARVMILVKRGEALTLKSMDCEGNIQIFPIYTEDASLSSVTVTGGEIVPAFDPKNTDYQVIVPGQISKLSIIGKALSETATIKGNITDKICTIGEKIVLTVTTDDGTQKKYSFLVSLTTGNSSKTGNSSMNIKVYPNPLEHSSTLSIDLNKYYNDIEVQILNTNGSVVYRNNTQGQRHTIPLSLVQGIYFVRLKMGQEVLTEKLIIK